MTEKSSHPKYRPDIDGLRAIAVLSVVLYHAFPNSLRGGFVGVDVFFVISGFLISTILFQGIDRGTFSIADFYSRRIRRIFPALGLVLFSVLLLGWICLFPEELRQLGKHTAASAGFIQNFALWKESGYFDNASETKPLLHIWSLGIEEQFYFLWPLVLWGAGRLGDGRRRKASYLIAALSVFIASFALNADSIETDPTKTFYLPQYRFWEMAAGGVLSWVVLYMPSASTAPGSPRKKMILNGLSFLGIAVLFAVFIEFSGSTAFPGKNALLPVVATAFIIFAGPDSFINRKILSNKSLVWVGLISFPLYLWHWPLLSFARILYGDAPPVSSRLILVAASVALSWATYALVEKRIRFHPSGKAVVWLCVFLAAALIAGQHIKDHSGFKGRGIVSRNLPETGFDGGDQGNLVDGCGLEGDVIEQFPVGGCRRDRRGTPTVALIGDSKSASLVTGLVRHSDEKSRILFIGGNGERGAVIPYNSINYSKDRDADLPSPLLKFAVDAIAGNRNIRTVILYYATRAMFKLKNDKDILDLPENENFDFAYERTNQLVQRLIESGKRIVIVVDNPTLPDPTSCIERKLGIAFIDRWAERGKKADSCQISYDRHLELSKRYRDLLDKIRDEHPKDVRVFDTVPLLCDMSSRICSMTLNGRRLYSYSDHISDYAAGIIAEKLIPFVRDPGDGDE